MRKLVVTIVAAGLLVAGCTAGSDDSGSGGGDAEESAAAAPSAEFPPDPRADGVTDDTIRLGITYVDLESLGDVVDIDHGDYQAAYNAVIDDINADGGINGRRIEPVFAPVVPIGTAPADEACVKLTEDEQVFAVVGFLLDDTPLCYLSLHNTPVVGGVITEERLGQAEAPWFGVVPGVEHVTTDLIAAFADDGVFEEARVGVIALPADESLMNEVTVPALEDAGVEVVDAAVIDADPDDQAAALQQVGVIAERFESEDIDTLVVVGNAALTTAQGLERLDYRPRLASTGFESLASYVVSEGGFDAEVVRDAITGGYATSGVQYDESDMQECASLVEDATGEPLPDPDTVAPGEPEPYVSAFAACLQLSAFRAIAEGAGEDLNNGTFGQAGYDLGEVDLPGDGGGATYGPDSLDGDMPIYLLRFGEEEGRLVSDQEPTG